MGIGEGDFRTTPSRPFPFGHHPGDLLLFAGWFLPRKYGSFDPNGYLKDKVSFSSLIQFLYVNKRILKMIPLSMLFEQENEIQIYCDMDGVLTDFNASAKKLGWKGPLPATKKEDKSALWAMVKDNAEKFWGDMPWKEDGKILWEFIKPYNPILLTSVASSLNSKLGRDGKAGKERWVRRELGPNWLKNNLIVVASHGKEKYANPNSILIDDFPSNIDPFVNAGGRGILHKNADNTIRQLKKILK